MVEMSRVRQFLARRWWMLGSGPVGFLIGYLAGRAGVPTVLIVVAVFVVTLSVGFVLERRTRRFVNAARAELAAEALRREQA